MPFGIEKRGGDYCTVNKATGAVKGNHGGNRKKAIAQLAILNQAMKDSGEAEVPDSDPYAEASATRKANRHRRRKRDGS